MHERVNRNCVSRRFDHEPSHVALAPVSVHVTSNTQIAGRICARSHMRSRTRVSTVATAAPTARMRVQCPYYCFRNTIMQIQCKAGIGVSEAFASTLPPLPTEHRCVMPPHERKLYPRHRRRRGVMTSLLAPTNRRVLLLFPCIYPLG